MSTVSLHDITKTYRSKKCDVVALDGVSIDVADGEFLVLVGPSGCGKTTTLRVVAGLETVDKGEVRIDDRNVTDVAPKDRDVAMVFQNYALYPHMTVFKNMAFGLKMRHTPKQEINRRVAETAEMLGIAHLLDRKPAALSGGEKQRVAVGRAIVRKPRAFLFDEPLSNLDARLRVRMRAELKRLHGLRATTSIYVTHDQEEAMTLGSRIAVKNNGVLQQCDTPTRVFSEPANRFVAGFIGTPAMNFLDGRIERGDSGLVFRMSDVAIPIDASMSATMLAYADRPVVMGIRPEAIGIRAGNGTAATKCDRCGTGLQGPFCHACGSEADGPVDGCVEIPARVEFVEPVGLHKDVSARLPDGPSIRGRIPAEARVNVGDAIRLTIRPTSTLFFEPGEAGARLSPTTAC